MLWDRMRVGRATGALLWLLMTIKTGGVQGVAQLRLAGGPTSTEGRVEILHDAQWGTICDDNWNGDYCGIVCSQLGLTGGVLVSGAQYGVCGNPIWLDDIKCNGDELALDECMLGFWGQHNCDHTEDVGCVCQPAANSSGGGSCDVNKHRIKPLDISVPWIGRVEVYNSNASAWQVVCDDFWGDMDAHVLCDCLGYTSEDHFRAYWSPQLSQLEPERPLGYDTINCGAADLAQRKNLWECPNTPSIGRCNARQEAAGVACGPVPQTNVPGVPRVNLTCEENQLSVCFTSSDYVMQADYLSLMPACTTATRRNITDGVCYDINMELCTASYIETDTSYKHYCYDVTYSQFDDDPSTLLIDNVWSRRACCSAAKNGTARAQFQPVNIPTSEPLFDETEALNFSLDCYTDKTFSGQPLAYPANVTRGQDLFCKVTALTWDSSLFLVVPECDFLANYNAPPSFRFLEHKCPTSVELDVKYFSFDYHHWGVQFQVPKFQGYDELYLSCGAYVCDLSHDMKPYCDRSCQQAGGGGRRRRDVSPQRSERELKHSAHVEQGPFRIQNDGTGPLITVGSQLHVVTMPTAAVRPHHQEPVLHEWQAPQPHIPIFDVDDGDNWEPDVVRTSPLNVHDSKHRAQVMREDGQLADGRRRSGQAVAEKEKASSSEVAAAAAEGNPRSSSSSSISWGTVLHCLLTGIFILFCNALVAF